MIASAMRMATKLVTVPVLSLLHHYSDRNPLPPLPLLPAAAASEQPCGPCHLVPVDLFVDGSLCAHGCVRGRSLVLPLKSTSGMIVCGLNVTR